MKNIISWFISLFIYYSYIFSLTSFRFNISFEGGIYFFYCVFNVCDSLLHFLYSVIYPCLCDFCTFLNILFTYFPQFGSFFVCLFVSLSDITPDYNSSPFYPLSSTPHTSPLIRSSSSVFFRKEQTFHGYQANKAKQVTIRLGTHPHIKARQVKLTKEKSLKRQRNQRQFLISLLGFLYGFHFYFRLLNCFIHFTPWFAYVF